jgi:hypothetical protein
MQSVGEERNDYRYLLLWLVQFGTGGKCPAFCCQDFFMAFLNCRFALLCFFNWTLQPIPSQSSNMQQARHCWCLNHRTMRCWVCCGSAFSSMTIRRKYYRLLRHGTGVRIGLWHTIIRTLRHLLRVTVTLTITQVTLLAQDSHTGLTVRTFDVLHLQSTVYRGVSSVLQQTEPSHINENPSQLFVLTARQGRPVPSTS